MTRHVPSLLAGLLVLLSATLAAAQAARPGRLNPPHLAEMPLVERVLREITASDPRDAAGRQMGAFEQLNEVIEELSGGRTAIGQQTPDEERIMGEYRTARFNVQQTLVRTPADEALLPALRRFDEDPALREEIVKRFFSPALAAQSRTVSQQIQARRTAMRQRQAANGGVPDAFGGAAARPAQPVPASVRANPAATGARATAPVGPPDPSIARARAAKVDTKVFGMQLGEPLSLPKCVGLFGGFAPTTSCVGNDTDPLAIATALINVIVDGQGEMVLIKLAKDSCPAWLSDCLAYGVIDGGRLMAVTLSPDSPQVEQAVSKELIGKYGRWSTATEHFITNNVTGSRFMVLDLRWNLRGLHVEYVPASAESISKGTVRIETDPIYQRRQEAAKEAAKPKL